MISFKRIAILALFSALVWSQITPNLVLGATSPALITPATAPGQALQIAPPLLNLNGNPGQTIKTQIDVTDISSGPLIVSNQINDFTAKGDTGVPDILFNAKANAPYSLKGFITPFPSFVLRPNQTNKLNIDINIPRNASPGGHFGVIRFTGTPASLKGSSGVSLSASLGALVLLTVSGHIVESLENSSFTVTSNGSHPSSFFQSDPFTFSEIIKNNGNEQVIPLGIMTLKDMFGHTVLKMNINEAQGNILPSTERKFSEVVDKTDVGSKLFFGHYTASYDIVYGSSKKHVTAALSFWVIPIDLIIIWIVVLIGGFFLIRYLIKRYNEHILEKAQKSSKKKK